MLGSPYISWDLTHLFPLAEIVIHAMHEYSKKHTKKTQHFFSD